MVSLFSHQCSTGGMFVSRRKHEPAHYMLKIESFSLLIEAKTPKTESDVFEANGHKWLTLFFITFSSLKCSFYNSLTSFQFFIIRRLDLYPNGNDEENEGSHISLYAVICDTESCPKGWEVCVDVCCFVYDNIHHNYVTIQVPVPEFTQLDRCLSMIKPLATKNTYTWTINKFSAVTESVLYSEIFKVGNVKWHLELYPEGNNIGEGTHLSIYLAVHDAASFADGWKVYAKFKICVKSEDAENDMEGGTLNISVPHFNVTGLFNIIINN
ncbi:putative ubiquitinyl hydrolase 1 [Helianthus annuus]|nr:putative ubiquitinyl hydrolase 1 [Helianthus annuus]